MEGEQHVNFDDLETEEEEDIVLPEDDMSGSEKQVSEKSVEKKEPKKKKEKKEVPQEKRKPFTRYHARTDFDHVSYGNLHSKEDLDWALDNQENLVILFHWPTCPYCQEFMPLYDEIANLIHRSNGKPGTKKITLLAINSSDKEGGMRDEIEKRRKGMSAPVPKILFKSSDKRGHVFEGERTMDIILSKMAEFFQDDTLRPMTNDLDKIMTNPKDFVFFMSTDEIFGERFAMPNRMMKNEQEGVNDLTLMMLQNPDVMNRGMAISVSTNRLDRPDIPVPSIYDLRDDTYHPWSHAMLWMDNEVNNN